jgi:hypothetical protein
MRVRRRWDVPETDDPLAAEEESPTTGQTQEPLLGFTSEFSWGQGQAPVDMGPTSGPGARFCFLTRIQGDFEGAGEFVRIIPRNGRWMLEGSSLQTGIGAGARCTSLQFGSRLLAFSGEFSWSQGQPSTFMGNDTGFRACLLTRVQGNFAGVGERVEITRSSFGSWFLGGASQQSGVAAGARCVVNVIAGPTMTYSTDCREEVCSIFTGCLPSACFGTGPTDISAMNGGFERDVACGLGKMTGKFEGGAEFVRIFLSNGSRWFLHAGGHQTSTYATSATCFL